MAWIHPQGYVRLFNTDLDPDCNHTFYFESYNAQFNYMRNAYPNAIVLEQQSYTRVAPGIFKANVTIADSEKINYMSWYDEAHGGKAYYAFVDRIDYVSELCCEVHFHLDVLQTYMFDWKLLNCFVERQHVMNDEIGQWLEPEPVQTGELVLEPAEKLVDLSDTYTIIAVKAQPSSSPYSHYKANFYDGVGSGCTFIAFDSTDTAGLQNFLDDENISAKRAMIDSIVSIYNIPKDALNIPHVSPGGTILGSGTSGASRDYTPSGRNLTEGFGGFIPHNNKLWTYPFYYLIVGNGMGTSMPLRYEFFENQEPKLHIDYSISQPVEAVLRPKAYGSGGAFGFDQVSPFETLTTSGFAMGAWSAGGYDSWVAQNSLPNALNAITGVVGSAISGNIAGAIGSVTNALMMDYRASYNAPEVRGSSSASIASLHHKRVNIWTSRRRLHRRKAEVIDEFMDMFGYQINRIMTPNLNARPFWTYVKTQNMILGGLVPSDYKKEVQNIFNRGVTFWKDQRNICDYSRDNRPS